MPSWGAWDTQLILAPSFRSIASTTSSSSILHSLAVQLLPQSKLAHSFTLRPIRSVLSMGRKGLVTSIFSKLLDTSPTGGQASPPSWPWPSCRDNPQTASFRAGEGDDDEEPCSTSRTPTTPPPTTAMARLNRLRGAATAGEMYKTVNSVYFDSAADDYFSVVHVAEGQEAEEEVVDDDESCFSTTTASEEWSEAVVRSLGRSTSTHRFFFDPGPPSINSTLPAPSSSPPPATTTTPTTMPPPTDDPPPPQCINKPAAAAEKHPYPEPDIDLVGDEDAEKQQQQSKKKAASSSLAEGSVAVAVDSSDPFGDFRASMEEMVAAHGLRGWAHLEELLSWYLRVNAKHHHPLIVGAFVDLLIGLASSPPSTDATTATTTSSGSSSGKSTKSSTTTTATTTTATTSSAMARRGGGDSINEASCSSSSSSCATPDDSQEKASDPNCSDDDHISPRAMSASNITAAPTC
ncbi:hypothetical protein QOZ80_5BG0429080 [Eleusine coracana subsp. coracana]|nr:hypothetical protein QOZ80_5BG0429080 [Eleusine coracana subsp. coracana]